MIGNSPAILAPCSVEDPDSDAEFTADADATDSMTSVAQALDIDDQPVSRGGDS